MIESKIDLLSGRKNICVKNILKIKNLKLMTLPMAVAGISEKSVLPLALNLRTT